jgi:4-amino-4-deoxy-L-arabinose transferase-like glycosyltransferase
MLNAAPESPARAEFRYIPSVRRLVRENLRLFLLGTALAFLLRALFIIFFPGVVNDSFVYGDIAKNWLQHGIYGLSGQQEISPTLIRLPGYPALLAFMFAIFGMEHYRSVLILQMFIDVGTCFLCADIARRLCGDRAAKIAFFLSALCPFLADYSAAALTETLEVFFTALAFDFALLALQKSRLEYWVGCGLACAGAIFLRPDGAMLLFALLAYIGWQIVAPNRRSSRRTLLEGAVIITITTALPLVPWTVRNWQVFHTFQPLTPRYANGEGEFVPMGFNRWVKTWIADYSSVEEVYWPVPGGEIDATKLPTRSFDDPEQKTETAQVIEDYNQELHITPDLDVRFEALARARIAAHPLRYYLELPAIRIADMWLRPRTEMLPCDTRWWEFNDEPKWSALAIAMGVINLCYLLAAALGLLRARNCAWIGVLLLFVLMRSLFLGTLENPEPRYTLEMYPAAIVFAGFALAWRRGDSEGLSTAA